MSSSTIIALLTLGTALVIGSLLLRVRTDGRYGIKTSDLVFLVLPLLVVALATGKLGNIEIFGMKADFSKLWAAAAQTKIEGQVVHATVQDAIQVMEIAGKGGVSELPRLIKRKTEALEFKLGQGGYYGPAIKTYFDALSGSSYLRVVVVDKPDGKLFGMYNAADLIGYLRAAAEQGYQQFAELLNNGSEQAQAGAHSRFPGRG